MAGFVQIIEVQSSRMDELRQLTDDYRAKREADASGPMPARSVLTEDRDRPGVFLNVVEFSSYEEAMENSQRPDTGEFARRMAELCDAPPRFYNLDVMETWSR